MAGKDNAYLFKRGEKVCAVEDLRGVPEGTRGKVAVADGVTWHRYWVRFDNGVMLGFVDESQLVKAKRYESYKREQREAAEQAEKEAATSPRGPRDEAPAAAEVGGGSATGGVTVPAHLLERSKAAKERLGA
ncbi:MAG: hypothetical protein JJLCMIEE_02566 [Acidimicrobiales bacterium]|nr:MAG: hypothetical protein EDR02_09665 [Actinomycetota bacterium]MBV6509475.1 hypothetical protein [Acidimicrobiales bacterium]RIK06789.1 MAG: hypothetical protein DCC48_06095 [Acidobacteriota bacterium]